MPRKKGLEEAEIQKMHTTAPEHLTDDELLLSTFSPLFLPPLPPLTVEIFFSKRTASTGQGSNV
jgi:hypothetical protein